MDVARHSTTTPAVNPDPQDMQEQAAQRKLATLHAIFSNPTIPPLQKCVMFGIVYEANADLAESAPGGARLATYASATRRETIADAIAALKERGVIRNRHARFNARVFTINEALITAAVASLPPKVRPTPKLVAAVSAQTGQDPASCTVSPCPTGSDNSGNDYRTVSGPAVSDETVHDDPRVRSGRVRSDRTTVVTDTGGVVRSDRTTVVKVTCPTSTTEDKNSTVEVENPTTVSPGVVVVGQAPMKIDAPTDLLGGRGPIPGVTFPTAVIEVIESGRAKASVSSLLDAVRSQLKSRTPVQQIESAMRKAVGDAVDEAKGEDPAPSALVKKVIRYVERAATENQPMTSPGRSGNPAPRKNTADEEMAAALRQIAEIRSKRR